MKHLLLFGAMMAATATAFAANPVEIAPVDGDITEALNAAKTAAGEVGDITINLTAGASYTVSGSLTAPAGLTINGNGASIDASALETAFVLMDATPTAELVNEYYRVGTVKIDNVNLSGVKGSLFYDNNVKYCVVDFSITNSTIALATTAVDNEAIISFKGGGAKDLTLANNTVYGNGDVAKYFVRYNNSARLDRYGFDKATEFQTMTYQNNTFYNLLKADGQWGNYNGIAGQNYSKFVVEKNIWFDCGKDIVRRMAGGRFGGSAPLTFAYNTYFNDGVSTAESEAAYDKSETILTSNPEFADPAAGNFTIGSATQQARYGTGAAKWQVGYDLKVGIDNGDIGYCLALLKETIANVGNITIDLNADANYTISEPIVAPAGLTINGNGAIIDASALEGAFILMDANPTAALINDYYRVDAVKIDNVTLNGVKGSLFYDNNVKYCVVDFSITNSTIALATAAVDNEAIISFKAGGAKDLTLINNTVYGNRDVAKYFVRYNNGARLDRYGFDKATEFQTMTYQNNTFYNLLKADGQWGNYNGIAGQNYSKFVVEKNIWFDCGKDIVRRMAGGRFGGSAPLTFAYNTYFNDGVSTAESEAAYDKSETILTSNPEFADPAAGNFAIGKETQQAEYKTGALKWLPTDGVSINTVDNTDAPVEYYNLQGVRVENPAAGIYIRKQGTSTSKVIIR